MYVFRKFVYYFMHIFHKSFYSRGPLREIYLGCSMIDVFLTFLLLLQFAKSKLQAVEMMKKISEHVTDHCILERIVPYLVSWPWLV